MSDSLRNQDTIESKVLSLDFVTSSDNCVELILWLRSVSGLTQPCDQPCIFKQLDET